MSRTLRGKIGSRFVIRTLAGNVFTKIFPQKRHYEDGVGAVPSMVQRLYGGVTGRGSRGFERKIKDIYKVIIRFSKVFILS
jgi:hypothetical protein